MDEDEEDRRARRRRAIADRIATREETAKFREQYLNSRDELSSHRKLG